MYQSERRIDTTPQPKVSLGTTYITTFTVDVSGLAYPVMTKEKFLEKFDEMLAMCALTVESRDDHSFGGATRGATKYSALTATRVLSESHAVLHTYPFVGKDNNNTCTCVIHIMHCSPEEAKGKPGCLPLRERIASSVLLAFAPRENLYTLMDTMQSIETFAPVYAEEKA